MNNRELYPECEKHGGRIVTHYEVEAELRKRHGGEEMSVLPEDADLLFHGAHPHARVEDGRLRCDGCGEVASSIHLLPSAVGVSCIQASCEAHDFGGYEIPVADDDGLAHEPFRWLHHLSSKVQFEATVFTLITWLGFDGAVALDKRRAA